VRETWADQSPWLAYTTLIIGLLQVKIESRYFVFYLWAIHPVIVIRQLERDWGDPIDNSTTVGARAKGAVQWSHNQQQNAIIKRWAALRDKATQLSLPQIN
jgi:hypothetical protein